MAKIKFITVKGQGDTAREPYYIGIPQHERSLSLREAYELCAEHTGYRATAVRAVFKALAEFVRSNQALGNITYIDGVASVRNYVRGAFEGLAGPWVRGVNLLAVNAVEMDPFKSSIAEAVSVNNTEGAKPVINTVLDETTREYDVITGTDLFSIAGSDIAPDAHFAGPPDRILTLVKSTRLCYWGSKFHRTSEMLSFASRPYAPLRFKEVIIVGIGYWYWQHFHIGNILNRSCRRSSRRRIRLPLPSLQ